MTTSALLRRKPYYTNQSIVHVNSFRHISDQKARRELGHRPRPIEETLFDLLDWYQQNGLLNNRISLAKCDMNFGMTFIEYARARRMGLALEKIDAFTRILRIPLGETRSWEQSIYASSIWHVLVSRT